MMITHYKLKKPPKESRNQGINGMNPCRGSPGMNDIKSFPGYECLRAFPAPYQGDY